MGALPGQQQIGINPAGQPVYSTPISQEQAQRQAALTEAAVQGHIVPELNIYQRQNPNYPLPEAPKPQDQPQLKNLNIDTSKIVLGPEIPVAQPKPSMVPPGTTTQQVSVPLPEYRQIGYTTYTVKPGEVRSEYGAVQKPEGGKVFDVEAIGKSAPSGSIVAKTEGGIMIQVPEWAALPPGAYASPGTSLYAKIEGGKTIEKGVAPTTTILQPVAAEAYLKAPLEARIKAIGHTIFSGESKALIESQIVEGKSAYTGKPRLVLAFSEEAASTAIGRDIARRHVQDTYISSLPYAQQQAAAMQLWQENIMTSATQSVPGILLTSYFGGALLGKAFSVAPSVIGKQATTAASWIFAGTMTTALASNVYGTITSTALTQQQKIVELATVGGAIYVGYKGFKEGPSIQSPIAYGTVKSKGGEVIYRTVFAQKGYSAYPLIGESGGKIILGMPAPEQIALPAGDLPQLQGNIGRVIGVQALKARYPEYMIEWKTDLFSLSSPLTTQKSAFVAKTLEFEKVGFTAKQAKILTNYLRGESKYSIRGSAGESPQLAEHLKGETIFGKIGDVDIQVGAGKAETTALARGVYEQYKAAGYKVKITTPEENVLATGRRTSTTIVNLEIAGRPFAAGKGGIALSFKPIGAEEYVYLGGKGQEIGEGLMRQPSIKIEGVKVQALGEQLGYRYLLTSTPQPEGFGPLPSRAPAKGKLDVPRLPVDIESQLLSREASFSQVVNPIYRAQTSYLRYLQLKLFGGPPGTIPLYESDTTGLIAQKAVGTYDYYPLESYYGSKRISSAGAINVSSAGSYGASSPGSLSLISRLSAPQSAIIYASPSAYPSQPSQVISQAPIYPSPISQPIRSVPSRYVGAQYLFIPLPAQAGGFAYGGGFGERKQKERLPAGRIAWKQGFMFKVWYSPFSQKSVKSTRKPIEGVKYLTGFKSATKSAVKRGGAVPERVSRTMGIVSIMARTPREKPSLMFKRRQTQTTVKKRKGRGVFGAF